RLRHPLDPGGARQEAPPRPSPARRPEDMRDRHDVHLCALDGNVEDVIDVGHGGEQIQRIVAAGERDGRATGVQNVRDDVTHVGPMGAHDVEYRDVVARLEELVHDMGADEAGPSDHTYTHDVILLDKVSSRPTTTRSISASVRPG